jgi:hypothetical protein
LPLEKIAQLACILGIIILGELVANSSKIAHLFGCYLSYLGLKKGGLKNNSWIQTPLYIYGRKSCGQILGALNSDAKGKQHDGVREDHHAPVRRALRLPGTPRT